MTRALRGRVGRVAAALAGDAGVPVTDAAWLAAFDRLAAAGYFAAEPDFPRAIAAYRTAHAATPETLPPAAFEPTLPFRDRYEAWRRVAPRPGVEAGRAWVAELLLRVDDGTPPVSEAEFGALAGWVRAHAPRLAARADADGLVPLGDGIDVDLGAVLEAVTRGPRSPGAGAAAAVLRRLRELTPTDPAPNPRGVP